MATQRRPVYVSVKLKYTMFLARIEMCLFVCFFQNKNTMFKNDDFLHLLMAQHKCCKKGINKIIEAATSEPAVNKSWYDPSRFHYLD